MSIPGVLPTVLFDVPQLSFASATVGFAAGKPCPVRAWSSSEHGVSPANGLAGSAEFEVGADVAEVVLGVACPPTWLVQATKASAMAAIAATAAGVRRTVTARQDPCSSGRMSGYGPLRSRGSSSVRSPSPRAPLDSVTH